MCGFAAMSWDSGTLKLRAIRNIVSPLCVATRSLTSGQWRRAAGRSERNPEPGGVIDCEPVPCSRKSATPVQGHVRRPLVMLLVVAQRQDRGTVELSTNVYLRYIAT